MYSRYVTFKVLCLREELPRGADLAMKSDEFQFDEIGYWSEIKLEILKNYATEYSKILSAQKKPPLHHIYIDAFAGAGIHQTRSSGDFVPGSPMNALSVQPPFKEYHLIDIAPEKVENLKKLVGQRSDVFIYEGDCNQILLEKVFPRVRYEQVAEAFRQRLKWVAGFERVPNPPADEEFNWCYRLLLVLCFAG
jgi:hypothetical protein